MADKTSPAVVSLEAERSTSARRAEPLQEALQQTFPADPVSATTTVIPTGSSRTSDQRMSESDAPRVDEALRSILQQRDDPYHEPREYVAALKDEVESLHDRAGADIRGKIRRNPWQAVGIAAAVGFLYGITH
jgi:ElaB/YqjD/DUF883 family membrane-anchored ribosome-binding protein